MLLLQLEIASQREQMLWQPGILPQSCGSNHIHAILRTIRQYRGIHFAFEHVWMSIMDVCEPASTSE